jgi:hypothetical protein
MTKPKRKKLQYSEYSREMNKIIAKHNNVADSLIEMLEYAHTVDLAGPILRKRSAKPSGRKGVQ